MLSGDFPFQGPSDVLLPDKQPSDMMLTSLIILSSTYFTSASLRLDISLPTVCFQLLEFLGHVTKLKSKLIINKKRLL